VANPRIVVAALSLSAAAMVGLWNHEGWTEEAVIPVKGDVPTVGPGLTVREDGSPVRMGDTITPLQGANRSLAHLQKAEASVKRCVTAPLHQVEYDLMLDFSYQYGVAALCKSSIVREANAGNYRASCEAYKKYRFVAGYDCSTPGNKRCWGVWKRSLERANKCLSVQ
jgi:lysozyme